MQAHDIIILALAFINIVLVVGSIWLIYHLACMRHENEQHFQRVIKLLGGGS